MPILDQEWCQKWTHTQALPYEFSPKPLDFVLRLFPAYFLNSVPLSGSISEEKRNPKDYEYAARRVRRIIPGTIAVGAVFPRVGDEVAALAKTVEHRAISLAELYRLASAIETAHARAGYVLARATIPPQQLVDGGVVRITIAHGFVEAVNADALPRRVRAAAAARLRTLVGRRGVTLPQLERQLLLTGEVAGVSLRSMLAREKTPGGLRLIAEGRWHPRGQRDRPNARGR